MADTFLLCRHCRAAQAIPSATFADDEEFALELALFRAEHGPHGIEEARRVPGSDLSDRPPWDPMATHWFRVSAGTAQLTVRCWRASIDGPRRYALEPGAMPATVDAVEIDESLLRRALDRHFYPQALRPTTLEAFIRTVRDLLRQLDPNEVETSFDDAAFANASIGPFPAWLCAPLLGRCALLFDPVELDRVRDFVADHRGEDGALAVRVRRDIITHAA
jgi:hypothetical protein